MRYEDLLTHVRMLLVCLLLLAAITALGALTMAVVHFDDAILRTSYDVHNTLMSISAATTTAVRSVGLVQADVHDLTSELTADSRAIALDIHRDIVVAGAAEAETEKTMRLVRAETPSFFLQAHQTLDNLNGLLTDANYQIPLAGDLLRSGRKLIDDSDAIVAGPTFTEFLAGAKSITVSTGAMTTSANEWFQAKLHPPKATGKMRYFINAWRIIHGGMEVALPPAELRYYLK